MRASAWSVGVVLVVVALCCASEDESEAPFVSEIRQSARVLAPEEQVVSVSYGLGIGDAGCRRSIELFNPHAAKR